MLKGLVRSSLLLAIGAGLGIWFAPPNAKKVMERQVTFAKQKAGDFHSEVGSHWIATAEDRLQGVKKIDVSRLNRKQFEAWVRSVRDAYDTVSDQAVRTQKSIAAVNSYLETAKNEFQKHKDLIPKT